MSVNRKELFGIVEREGQDKGFWTRIGTAFENKDGSFNLFFDYFPSDSKTRIQMRDPYVDPKEKDDALISRGKGKR